MAVPDSGQEDRKRGRGTLAADVESGRSVQTRLEAHGCIPEIRKEAPAPISRAEQADAGNFGRRELREVPAIGLQVVAHHDHGPVPAPFESLADFVRRDVEHRVGGCKVPFSI